METMNLIDNGEGMVPLQPPAPPSLSKIDKPANAFVPDSNNNLNNKKDDMGVDSTPIMDVMPPDEMPPMPMQGQAPAAMQMMAPQQVPVAQAPAPSSHNVGASKNPMNLTDEQMQALVAAASAALAFSGPVQEKLGTMIPNFLTDGGDRSTTGLIVTAIMVALAFYFGQRFAMRS